MLRERLIAMYDAQLRGDPEMYDAPTVTTIGPVLVGTFPVRRRCFVTYPPFAMAGSEVDDLIEEVIAHAVAHRCVDHIKWKLREHDPVPELLQRLREHGFIVHETETVLAGRVEDVIGCDPGVPDGYTTERAVTELALRQAERLAGQVFGDSPQRIREQEDELIERCRDAPESFEMWLARDAEGSVACSGRVDFVDGTDFAGLWGGACDRAHRGRGLYRALVGQRARSAQARGKRYIQVDCSEDSRPILERAGLIPITTVTAVIWNCDPKTSHVG